LPEESGKKATNLRGSSPPSHRPGGEGGRGTLIRKTGENFVRNTMAEKSGGPFSSEKGGGEEGVRRSSPTL